MEGRETLGVGFVCVAPEMMSSNARRWIGHLGRKQDGNFTKKVYGCEIIPQLR